MQVHVHNYMSLVTCNASAYQCTVNYNYMQSTSHVSLEDPNNSTSYRALDFLTHMMILLQLEADIDTAVQS